MVREVVERIRRKDQRAMSQLYQQYVEELSSVCYRYVPAESDAKEVLQNSFVKIFTAIPSMEYRSEVTFESWMKRVVVNEALHYLREKNKLQFAEQDVDELKIADEEPEPEPEMISPDELHRLIRELPDGFRTVLNLYVFEGYSHREIAQQLGIKESTSASQFYFAKQRLARQIKKLMKGKQ